MPTIECICDNCGKSFNRQANTLRQGLKRNVNLFCSITCGNTYRYGNIGAFRKLLNHARARKLELDIDLDYLKDLYSLQQGKCAISGLELHVPRTTKDFGKGKTLPTTISLDRIDSDKGYVKGNVQLVCLSINLAKSCFSQQQMLDFVHQIKHTE